MGNQADQNELLYWRQLGLQGDPFSVAIHAQNSYVSPVWREYLDRLAHLSRYASQIITVTGVAGIGKTCLKHRLTSEFNDDIVFSELIASDALTPQELLHCIRHDLLAIDHFSGSTKPSIEQQTGEVIDYLDTDDRVFVLLIDNAERLDLTVLRLLERLIFQQKNGHFHVILFGQSELLTQLASVCAQNAFYNIEMQGFNEHALTEYLNHLFKLAGLQRNFPLPAPTISQILQASNGVPGTINYLTKQSLLAALRGEEVPTAPPRWKKLVFKKSFLFSLTGLIVIVGLFVLLMVKTKTPPPIAAHIEASVSEIATKKATPIEATKLAAPIEAPAMVAPEQPTPSYAETREDEMRGDFARQRVLTHVSQHWLESFDSLRHGFLHHGKLLAPYYATHIAASTLPKTEKTPMAPVVVTPASTAASATINNTKASPEAKDAAVAASAPASAQSAPGSPVSSSSAPSSLDKWDYAEPLPSAQKSAASAANAVGSSPEVTKPAAPVASVAPAAAATNSSATTTSAATTPTASSAHATSKSVATVPAESVKVAPAETAPAAKLPPPVATSTWVSSEQQHAIEQQYLSLPRKHYSIQIALFTEDAQADGGMRAVERARRYVAVHGLQHGAYVVRANYRGQPAVLIVYGAYPSWGAGEHAITGLPSAIRQLKPWLRTVGSVQMIIKK